MKVLVTGGAGYFGSVLVRTLLQEGHDVTVLDSLLRGDAALLPLITERRFSFFPGDIREEKAARAALCGAEAVIHLAAIVGDPACAAQPQLAREVNEKASLQLFKWADEDGARRFLFASTCSNYGRMENPDGFVDENSALNPISLYAQTKVAVERAILAADSMLTVTVLRFATLFGLSPQMRWDLTVNEFTKALLLDRKVEVFGKQFYRPYIHVRDAARAVAQVLISPSHQIAGRVFNVGDSGLNFRKGDLTLEIQRTVGGESEIRYVERKDDPRDYRVCFDRIHSELDFRSRISIMDGVNEMVRQFPNH